MSFVLDGLYHLNTRYKFLFYGTVSFSAITTPLTVYYLLSEFRTDVKPSENTLYCERNGIGTVVSVFIICRRSFPPFFLPPWFSTSKRSIDRKWTVTPYRLPLFPSS